MIDSNVVNITLIYGQDINEAEANELVESLQTLYPQCEVTMIDGGQPVYYYLVSLE